MYQFFVRPEQISGNEIILEGIDFGHIKNVLRMKPGDKITVSRGEDGQAYLCRIAQIEETQIICEMISKQEEERELPAKVYLFQGLPKSDKMEWIIQKAVELGVYEIIPVASRRAVVKLDDKKEKQKIARWQSISEAAAKQSKRMLIPRVHGVLSMKEAVTYAADMDSRLIPYEKAEHMKQTRDLLDNIKEKRTIAVFIGPEGGFDEEEITLAKDNGILPVTLGKRILRTETAGMVVLSWLMYFLETD